MSHASEVKRPAAAPVGLAAADRGRARGGRNEKKKVRSTGRKKIKRIKGEIVGGWKNKKKKRPEKHRRDGKPNDIQ